MTLAVPRPLRAATALALALLLAPAPGWAAGGGGGHGGGMGGGRMGGMRGGDVFHVHGGISRGDPSSQRPGGFGPQRGPAPERTGSVERAASPDRGAAGVRGGGAARSGARAQGRPSVARRARLSLRRLFARQARLRTSRCDRTLYERYNAPHSCNTSRAYGAFR